ncbi:MAG: type II secretion system F family protein [Desulfuromonas sp.]|nr:MAG: type II secretion system F family protein [Desulfuromonas sp.]
MPSYVCKIGTADGRVVEKSFEAASRQLLEANLKEQGFHVFRIRRKTFQLFTDMGKGAGRLSSRRFLAFNQEFLVLLKSGLPILQVLDTIAERLESGSFLDVLTEIRDEVKGGAAISEAFGKFPRHFPHLYIATIRAGERTGDLPVTLERYIAYQKRAEKLKSKVQSASFYPILLSIAVAVVLLFLMLYVVPSFTQIYADADVELPIATRVIIFLAEWLVDTMPFILPGFFLLLFVIKSFIATERGRIVLDRAKLIVPFFSRLLVDYALSSFCRTLSTTMMSGIPIVQAMQMSRGTLNNRILEDKLHQATLRVEEGTAISTSLEQAGFFPGIALRMIGVGESSGSLAEMLSDVADYYEDEVERRLDRLTTMIEPLMMLCMGLLIGGIVVAMYIPIFQLAGTVR